MLNTRVIPCLLLKGGGLVKTEKFNNPRYVGDPINAVKIFNAKAVDELIILDITATIEGNKPQFKMIEDLASECFMPVCYGGGINNIDDIRKIFNVGIEKVAINSAVIEKPDLIRDASKLFGSQSILISIDVKRNYFGKPEVYTYGGKQNTRIDPVKYALQVQELGAGEILLNSINRDGTMEGYDIELLKSITQAVSVPVIACGGAGKLEDFSIASREGGVNALAAGSVFVFHGRHRAVLISYPSKKELQSVLT